MTAVAAPLEIDAKARSTARNGKTRTAFVVKTRHEGRLALHLYAHRVFRGVRRFAPARSDHSG